MSAHTQRADYAARGILVAGCGYVGAELARMLAQVDHATVWGLRRRPVTLPAGVRPVVCNLVTKQGFDDLPGDIDAIVYAVGADASSVEAYENAYVRGLANLLDALSAGVPPRRLIVVTSTAVYAQDLGEWVDEESPTMPAGFSGQVLLRCEALARSAPCEAVVMRFGGIYGPGRTRLVDAVRGGSAGLGDHPEYTNRIHRDDCAGALRHLLKLESPARCYIGVDDEPADRRVVFEWLAERIGVEPPPLPPPSPEKRASGKRCSNRRLRSSGYVFRFPTFREGYENVLTA